MEKSIPQDQHKQLEELHKTQEELSQSWVDYWQDYSHFGTWQFWMNVAMFVVPLVVLYFKLDRKRAFLLGFYGLNVHVWFTYIDAVGVRHGLWSYPYQAFPFMPVSFGLDASLIPIVFMLVYQWTLNNNKNYYLWVTVLTLVLSFGLKPIMVLHNFFHLHKGIGYLHLLAAYLVIMLLSKWLTNLFIYFEKKAKVVD